jgi:hypothetical protein
MQINILANSDADHISRAPLDAVLKELRELCAEVPKMTPQEIVELIAEARRRPSFGVPLASCQC